MKKRIDSDIINKTQKKIELPVSNVIQLFLEDGSKITARPSGTEPKIKFYFACIGNSAESAGSRIKELEKEMMDIVK